MPLTFWQGDCNSDCGCNSVYPINASIKQGETINYQWNFTSDGTTPANLTGYTFQIAINFPAPIYFDSNGNGLTINSSAGTVTWNVSDSVTTNWIQGNYYYEFFGIDSGGNRMCDWSGAFSINQSITPISA